MPAITATADLAWRASTREHKTRSCATWRAPVEAMNFRRHHQTWRLWGIPPDKSHTRSSCRALTFAHFAERATFEPLLVPGALRNSASSLRTSVHPRNIVVPNQPPSPTFTSQPCLRAELASPHYCTLFHVDPRRRPLTTLVTAPPMTPPPSPPPIPAHVTTATDGDPPPPKSSYSDMDRNSVDPDGGTTLKKMAVGWTCGKMSLRDKRR